MCAFEEHLPALLTLSRWKRRRRGRRRGKGKKDCSIRWLRKETNLLTSLLRHTSSLERRTNRLPRFDTGLGKLCRSFLKQTFSLSLSLSIRICTKAKFQKEGWKQSAIPSISLSLSLTFSSNFLLEKDNAPSFERRKVRIGEKGKSNAREGGVSSGIVIFARGGVEKKYKGRIYICRSGKGEVE